MKKYLSIMFLAAMTACAFVSCGGDDDDSPKGSETSKTLEPKTFTVEKNGRKVSFTMMPVEAGKFTMGTPGNKYDDETPHSVTLTKDYYIGETEVTQGLWLAVMGSKPSKFSGISLPVEQVTWSDCQDFIQALNSMTGQKFRLPTEAEWEYAARGGKKSNGYEYSGSNTLDDVAWYYKNSSEKTHAVKSKAPNELGIYDMSGNVYEWCQDWYGAYSSSSQTNPKGPSTGSIRVHRGGSWNSIDSFCRSSYRDTSSHDYSLYLIGLRLAL